MNDLQTGKTVVDNESMTGFKFLTNCVLQSQPSLLDALIRGRKTVTYDRCFTKVTMKKGSEIIRPSALGNLPSNDLRTDNYITGEIVTFDGKLCSEAISPVRDIVYEPHTKYTSGLNTDCKQTCVQGLHFYPSFEALIDDRFGFTGWK